MNKKLAHKIIYLLIIPVVLVFAFAACPSPIDNNLVTLVEDKLAPVITVTEPQNYGQYKSTISMSGVIEDSSTTPGDKQGRVSTLSYEVQGHYLLAGEISLSADGQFGPVDIDATGLSGREVIVVTAEDWNGNISEEEIILDEDTSGPYIDIPNVYSEYTNQVTISGTIANSQSDSTITEVKSITWEVISDPTLTETLTFDVSGNGDFTVTPSAATIEYYDPNDFDFTVNTVLLVSTQYIKVTAEDWGGHTTEILCTITDGKVGPYLEVYSPNNLEPYHGTVTITGKVQNGASDTGLDGVGLLSCSFLVSGGDEGTITFTDPLLPTFNPTDGTITFNASNEFSITLSTTSPVVINDNYLRISIWAEDKTNKKTSDSIDLVKSGGPYLSINTPLPYTNTVSITGTVRSWDGAPDAAEIDTLTYSLGAAVDQPLTFNAAGAISDTLTTSALTGDQTLPIKATDGNGIETTASITLTDGLAPILNVDSPGTSYDGTDLSITGTVYDHTGAGEAVDVASLEYSWDGSNYANLNYDDSDGEIDDSLGTSTFYGTQTLTIRATDDDGNSSQTQFSLTDDIDPVLTITTPEDNETYGDPLTITGKVEDYVGANSAYDVTLTYSLDAGANNPSLPFTPASGEINYGISGLTGSQTLTITANDGDNSTSVTITGLHNP